MLSPEALEVSSDEPEGKRNNDDGVHMAVYFSRKFNQK